MSPRDYCLCPVLFYRDGQKPTVKIIQLTAVYTIASQNVESNI